MKSLLLKIEKYLDRHEEDAIQSKMEKIPFVIDFKVKLGLLSLATLLAFFSLIIFYNVAKKITPPDLFFIDENGKLSRMETSIYPTQSKEVIQEWALEGIQKTYTFDFLKMDDQLEEARVYFTPDAWGAFKKVMFNSPLVKDVKKNRLSVSVVAKEDPIIYSAARDKQGEFAWKLIVPVTINFDGDAPTEATDLLIKITVIRVPTEENPKGLGIQQMTFGPLEGTKK